MKQIRSLLSTDTPHTGIPYTPVNTTQPMSIGFAGFVSVFTAVIPDLIRNPVNNELTFTGSQIKSGMTESQGGVA